MAPRCPQNNFRTFQHDSRKLLTVRSLQMSSDPRLSLSSFIPILSRPAISSSRPELLAVSPTLHALSRLLNFPTRHCFCLETAYFPTPTMAHHRRPATARHGPPQPATGVPAFPATAHVTLYHHYQQSVSPIRS